MIDPYFRGPALFAEESRMHPKQSFIGRIKYIGIDFDGTVVEHRYPDIGPQNGPSLYYLRKFIECGAKLILCTMRSGDPLDEAVLYLEKNEIELYGVNENPDQISWTDSPKPWCHLYIDDAAFGCPLIQKDRMAADWTVIGPQVLWLLENNHVTK